jgi:integrase
VKAFWQACATVGEPKAQCLQLLLLTGCRRAEIGNLRRGEINEKDGTITIPGSRTKNKRTIVLPLPPLAQEILRSVKTSGGDQIFTNGRGLAWSRIKAQLDAAMKPTAPWRLHDLRRVFSTGLSKIGVEPHIVEACLNHYSGARSGVAGTYNVWHYAPEKATALARWSDHVIGLVEGRAGKVLPMKRKARGR